MPVSNDAAFCGSCGAKLADGRKPAKKPASSVIDHLNEYLGNEGKSTLTWKDLFSEVFKSHNIREAEDIFICGTLLTTPKIEDVRSSWRRPWLYSRVFVAMFIASVLLFICCDSFNNPNAYPGLLVIGAFTIPLCTLMLFMEVNAYRNISFYKVLLFFIVGGCASLVATLFLFSLNLVDAELGSLWGGLMVGLLEETGKAVIVYLIIRQFNVPLKILPCMLVGAAVGAGFAAFESAGYAFQPFFEWAQTSIRLSLMNNQEIMLGLDALLDKSVDNILLRGYLAPGGHVAWAAISGAAIALAAKAQGTIDTGIFKSRVFWKIFIIPIVLHGLWDTPMIDSMMWYVILIAAVWVIVVILIDMGLKQIPSANTVNDKGYDLSAL